MKSTPAPSLVLLRIPGHANEIWSANQQTECCSPSNQWLCELHSFAADSNPKKTTPPPLKPNADQEACSDQPRKPSVEVAPVAARLLPCAMHRLLRRHLFCSRFPHEPLLQIPTQGAALFGGEKNTSDENLRWPLHRIAQVTGELGI
ncbi:hypothetical protein U1Q18_024332 [Sarracenia purpurea var. burkii]